MDVVFGVVIIGIIALVMYGVGRVMNDSDLRDDMRAWLRRRVGRGWVTAAALRSGLSRDVHLQRARMTLDPSELSPADLAGADHLDSSWLRRVSRSQVAELGTALSATDGDPDNPGRDRALACYDAAALLVAERDDQLDVLGAIVLAREGLTALTDRDPHPLPVCQVHPLHGQATRRPRPGQRPRRPRQLLAVCAGCKKCSVPERDQQALLAGGVPYYRAGDSGRVSGSAPSTRSCRPGCWSISVLSRYLRRFRQPAGGRPAVFALAETADTERVRRRAQEAVIAFGEELEAAPPSDDLNRGLDAYQAATMALDHAVSVADLAGVLVLVNTGRGGPPLCFFNPLHGPSSRRASWRLIGTREQLQVPVCALCQRAISRHRPPAVLPDTVDGERVPYLDVDPERSVWAATGFGVYSDDLVERILRGDLRHRRAGA
jgi:hypothetical protein